MWLHRLAASALLVTALSFGMGSTSYAETSGADTCDLNDPYCHRFTKAEEYFKKLNPDASEEEWLRMRGHLRAFTDPVRLAQVMGDPVQAADFMAALSDPDAVHLMLRCAQEPIMWDTWLRVMTNPEKMMNAGLVFINPLVYFNWMMAPLNPQVYAKLAPLVESELWSDWAAKSANPTFYEPLYSWIDPQWSVDRIFWAMNPNTYGNMFAWFTQALSASTPTTALNTQ